MNTKTNIDELFDCLKWNQIILQIDDEIMQIDNQFIPKSPLWGEIKGNGVGLETRYINALERKEELVRQRKNCSDLLKYIDSKIYELPDGISCRILHLRFIAINYNHRKPKPYTLEEIADIIGYSYRGMYKRYKKALSLYIEVHNNNSV